MSFGSSFSLKWNTSNVNNFQGMFNGCNSLYKIDGLSSWDTKNVIDMSWMFRRCFSLMPLPDINTWDTKNVKNINQMCFECSKDLIVNNN